MNEHQKQTYGERILRVWAFLEQNADKKLTLMDIAEIAYMSDFHFHRIYKAATGETVFQTYQRFRMYHAKKLIREHDIPLKQISKSLGFSTPEAFTRFFKQSTGSTPSEWRYFLSENIAKQRSHVMRNITFTQKDEFLAVSLAHQGDYMLIAPKFERLFAWAAKHNQLQNIKSNYGAYYDDPNTVAKEDLRAKVLFEFKDASHLPPLDDDMESIIIPKQKYVTIEHKGPYEHLQETYDWFFGTWIMDPKNQLEFAEQPTLEEYLNCPRETAPQDLITLIHVAIK